jgi:5-methyltetrahydrofolate--homocysteine methyltransferase
MTFSETGRSFMGAAPADMVRKASAAGLAAIGANCSLGPFEIIPVIKEIIEENNKSDSPLPLIAQPNAGQPVYKNGSITYEITTNEFAEGAKQLLNLGISAIGGCCGTTPEMIAAIRGIIDNS